MFILSHLAAFVFAKWKSAYKSVIKMKSVCYTSPETLLNAKKFTNPTGDRQID